ncbi:CDP-glycerol glycerophosphotransferase family protein [Alteromonas ponticola]|uniref:CDP-glycerol--poly(Glycerophosphate) glycerophosphotransferase n=1 Tax=Alteromonas ponticola TaxID=2720613 RepID=A0ABX1R0N7_9ALTE|nr:CDP-glycerol glycerophosphotransferase family protein [Alteromonas ponticola]NMH59634.1 CDP-glycerol--poly(glycerophosphate) glycerophosphotransferase [Alteromonas ponticola]
MFNHYRPVWKKLKKNSFDLVLFGEQNNREISRNMAASEGFRAVDHELILESEQKYSVLVSNHSMFEHKRKSINFSLGVMQVRFMYALGKAKHNFSSWNNDYDLILCFGPYQAERLKQCCSATIFQMGYPRYDGYFTDMLNKDEIKRELGLDERRKTIVWLPTWKELSSIDKFAPAMSLLSTKYNVIVKTHPLAAEEEPERVNKLKEFKFTKVITEIYDNLNLYTVSDWVVADYGGPAFGAIYLDKPLLLLNMPNAEDDALTGEDSPDILLRNQIVNIDAQHSWQIEKILSQEQVWQKQATSRQALRRQHFYPSYGFSADLAAVAIQNVQQILTMTKG